MMDAFSPYVIHIGGAGFSFYVAGVLLRVLEFVSRLSSGHAIVATILGMFHVFLTFLQCWYMSAIFIPQTQKTTFGNYLYALCLTLGGLATGQGSIVCFKAASFSIVDAVYSWSLLSETLLSISVLLLGLTVAILMTSTKFQDTQWHTFERFSVFFGLCSIISGLTWLLSKTLFIQSQCLCLDPY